MGGWTFSEEKYGDLDFCLKKYAFAIYMFIKISVVNMGVWKYFLKKYRVRKYFGKKYGVRIFLPFFEKYLQPGTQC